MRYVIAYRSYLLAYSLFWPPSSIVGIAWRSVADPDPDPSDPFVIGPLGSASGSVSHKYGSGSGSGSFHHQANIVRKTLMSTFEWLLYDFLSLKKNVNVPMFRIRRIRMFLALPDPHPDPLVRGTDPSIRIASGSVPKCHGSATRWHPLTLLVR
jgi:hypothetical protein